MYSELQYNEKLKIFHDTFVKYAWNFVKRQKASEQGQEVPIMTTPFKDTVRAFRIVPVVGVIADITLLVSEIWNGRVYNSNNVSFNKIFVSDRAVKQILSKAIQEVAIHVEIELSELQDPKDIGAFATDAVLKLIMYLKNRNPDQVTEITVENIVEAILSQNGWFTNDKFLAIEAKETENNFFLTEEELRDILKNQKFDDYTEIIEDISSINSESKIDITKIIKDNNHLIGDRQIIIKLQNTKKVQFPQYLIITNSAFSTDIDSLRLDAIEEQTRSLQQKSTFQENQLVINFDNVNGGIDNFIGRIIYLKNIYEYFSNANGGVQIIGGIPGIGKTQIALKYINDHKEEYGYRVRWIMAEDESSLQKSFREFAEDLSIDIRKSNSQNIVKLVLDYLEKKSEKTLLFFDNAIDMKILRRYLPSPKSIQKHDIIITTTNTKSWIDSSPSRHNNIITLGPFSMDEAIEYVENTLAINPIEQIEKLSELFSYVPLGLSQSIAFIRNAEISIEEYLREYEQKKQYFAHIEMYDLSLEDESEFAHKNNIYVALELTLGRVSSMYPDAYHIIRLCSYLRTESIPISLFNNIFPFESDRSRAISILKGFSLLTLAPDTNQYVETHRIIQEVITMKMSAEDKINDLVELVHNIIQQGLFTRDNTTKQKYENNKKYILHIENILENTQKYGIAFNPELIYLALSRAVYYDFSKDHLKARNQLIDLKQLLKEIVHSTDCLSAKEISFILAKKDKKLPTLYAQICYHLGKSYLSLSQEMSELEQQNEAELLSRDAKKEFEEAVAVREIIDTSPQLYDDMFNEGINRPMDSIIFQRQGILLWHKLQKKKESTELALEGYKALIKQELAYNEETKDNFNLETCRRLVLECMDQKMEMDNSQDPSILYVLLENAAVNLGIKFDKSLTKVSERNLLAEKIFEALAVKTPEHVRVARDYNLMGKIFLKIYSTTQESQDRSIAKKFVERAKILEESVSQKSFILSDANKILERINSLENKIDIEKNDLSNPGGLVTNEQMSALLQIIKENSDVGDKIDFTASITEENIDFFIERITLPEEIVKIHFGVININSDNNQDNKHLVSYIQLPNIYDASGEVVGVRSIIINSAGNSYSLLLNRIRSKIENIFSNKQIQITLQVRNLEYQTRDIELHQDWNTCGIWVNHFFEGLVSKIAKLDDISNLKFDEILSYTNIYEKRREYSDLLQALSLSINNVIDTKDSSNIFQESRTSIDEILSKIDTSISLSEKPFREEYLMNSEQSRELLEVIKDNSYPPILEQETLEAEKIRYEKLVSSFTQLGEMWIHRVEEEILTEDKINALIKASKFFNYAINIAKKHSLDSSISYSMLEYINHELIFMSGGTTPSAQSALTNSLRENSEILELRNFAREKLGVIESLSDEDKVIRARELFENIAEKMKGFLARLFKESEAILGKAPCKYSVMALGSMALKTITPYSDLEFAIIIEKESQEIKEYFKKLTQLVHFRIINLGETVIPESDLGGCNTDHLIRRGVSFDLGGKTPLGRKDKNYELIQTIDGMLHYLRNIEDEIEHIDKNLPYILEVSDHVYGNIELHKTYVEQSQKFLFDEVNSVGLPNHETRAIKRLKEGVVEYDDLDEIKNVKRSPGDIETFNPERISQEVEGKFFDAKQEIYRLPDRLIYGLSLLYKIQFNNPWDVVHQLKAKGIIDSEYSVVHNLQYLVSYAVYLRLKVYLYNNKQQDEVYLFDVNTINLIRDKDEQEVSNFVEQKMKESGIDVSDAVLEKSEKEVRQLYMKHHVIDPLLHKDNTALSNKGFTLDERDLAEDGALVKFYYVSIPFHRTLKQLLNKYDDLSVEARNSFFIDKNLFNDNNLVKSLIYIRCGNFLKAISYLEKADSETLQTYNKAIQTLDLNSDSPLASLEFINKISFILSALASSYSKIGRYSKSVEVELRFIEILKYLYPDDNKFMAGALENIANSYLQIKDYSKSIEYHLKSLEIKQRIYDDVSEEIAQSLGNIAIIYNEIGDYNSALNYLIKSKRIYENKYKIPNVATINCLMNMANALLRQAKYNEAIELYNRSFEIALLLYKSLIHPLVSKILNSLGQAYHNIAMIDKAVHCYVQCYQINKIIYGDKPHRLVIMSLERLGSIHSENGDFDLAENYITQAAKMKSSLYEFDNSELLSSYYQFALLYFRKGDLVNAVKCLTEAIEQLKQIEIPGREFHQELPKYLSFLGVLYNEQCNFSEAIEALFQALQMSRLIHEYKPHPEIAQCLCNIAMVYSGMENFDQAIEYYEQALKMQEEIYRSTRHPDIVKTLNGIASVYSKKDQNNEAIETYKKAIEIQNSIYDCVTPITISLLSNLAATYATSGNLEESYSILSKNLEQLISMHNGESHTSIANTYSNIGNFFYKKKEFDNAIEEYNRALEIRKKLNEGNTHLDIAIILGNIGEAYLAKGEYVNSLTYYLQSLEIKRKIYKNNMNINIAKILNNIGTAFYKTGKIEEAIESFQESLEIKNKIYSNRDHKEISSTLVNLGTLFLATKKFDESIKYYEMALKIEKELGDEKNTIDISNILNNLGEAYRETGNYLRAIDCGLECLARKKAIFQDVDHEEIATSLNNIGNAYSCTNPELALVYYIQSLEMKQKIYKIPNEEIVHTLINIARINLLNKNYDDALQYFLQSIEALKVVHYNGAYQHSVLCLVQIASIYNNRKEFENSLQYIIQAHEINNKLYNAPHDEITKTLNYLGEAYIELKIFDKGLQCFTDCLEMRKELYQTMYHPDVRLALNKLGVAYRKFIEHYNFSPFVVVEAGIAHLLGKYDFTDYKLHYDKAISCYQNERITSAIDEFRIALIFAPSELGEIRSLIAYQLALSYYEQLMNNSDDVNYDDYHLKIEHAYVEAFKHISSKYSEILNVDYSNFLFAFNRYTDAKYFLLKVINNQDQVVLDDHLDVIVLPNIIDKGVIPKQLAYHLLLINYDKLNVDNELKAKEDYLDEFKKHLNSFKNIRGYFLLKMALESLGYHDEASEIIFKVNEMPLESKTVGNIELSSEVKIDTIIDISNILVSVEVKELVNIIKDNIYPPILEQETPEAKKIKYERLVSSFAQIGEILIHEAEEVSASNESRINILMEASKFFNYAINIAANNNMDFGASLIMIEYINSEILVLTEATGIPSQPILVTKETDKGEIELLRENARSAIQDIESSSDEAKVVKTRALFENIAEKMKGFLARLFKESEAILGETPCKYSVIGLGSMALKTITPYSDLEFAIIIEKESPEIKEYFKKLTQLVHFRIINLGETVIPESDLDGCDTDHLISRGVSFDLGGKTPLGKEDKNYDLIQTIDGMLRYLRNDENKIEHIDKNLPYILEVSDHVYGNIELHKTYVEQAQKFLFEEMNPEGIPNHETRAIRRLQDGVVELDYLQEIRTVTTEKGDINKYRPELSNQEDEDRAFNIKNEIYRIPDRLLYSLLIYSGKSFSSIWDGVFNLSKDKVASANIANEFLYALTFANWLRIKTYINHNSQKEFVDYISILRNIQNDGLSKELYIENSFPRFYAASIFLHIGLTKLINKEKNIFRNDEFFLHENEFIKGIVYKRLGDYDKSLYWLAIADQKLIDNIDVKRLISQILITRIATPEAHLRAIEYSRRCVELSPPGKMPIYITDFIVALKACGRFEEAKEMNLKLLELDQRDVEKAIDYMNLALIEKDLNEFKNAENHFDMSLKLLNPLPDSLEKMLMISNVMINQGDLFMLMQKLEDAEKALKGSLAIRQKYKGENSISAIEVNLILANLYLTNGEIQTAKQLYIKLLSIFEEKDLHNGSNSMVLKIRNSLAIVFEKENNYEESLKIHFEILEIRKNLFGIESSEVAQSYDNIASTYSNMGKKLYARKFLQDAAKIHTANNNLLNLQRTLIGLASINSVLGEYNSATQCFELAVQKIKQIDGLLPIVLAEAYLEFGLHELRFDNDLRAKELFNLADTIYKENHVHNDNLQSFLNLLEFDQPQSIDNELHQMLYSSAISIGAPLRSARHLTILLESSEEMQNLQKPTILASIGSLYNIYSKRLKYEGNIPDSTKNILNAEHYFKSAIEFGFDLNIYTEYVSFLTDNGEFGKAIIFLNEVLLSGYKDENKYLIYSTIERPVIPGSLYDLVEKHNGSVKVSSIGYAYYMILHYYKDFAAIAELKSPSEYLQEFKKTLYDSASYYLYGRITEEMELENDVFLSTEIGLKFLEIAEKTLSEEKFKKFLEFCSNKHIEEQVISENDAQEFEILLNLLLNSQEELEAVDKVSAGGSDELLEKIDKIKAFIGEKELSDFPGFYQYVFNALSNNRFSESATKILSTFSSLISSLEKLMDLSLLLRDEEIEENSDIGTSIWTQLEYLLEFTVSGQRFIGAPPRPPYFDPDDYYEGGSGGTNNNNNPGLHDDSISQTLPLLIGLSNSTTLEEV